MRPPLQWIAIVVMAAAAVLGAAVFPLSRYLAAVATLFVLAAAATALVAQLQKPLLGLALLVVTAVAFPFEFRGPAGVLMGSSFPLAAGLCAIWLLRTFLGRPTPALERSRVVYAVLAFMGATLASFAMGQFPWYPSGGAPLPAQVAELGIFLVSACLFLAVGHQIVSIDQLKALSGMLIAAGLVTCLVQTLPGLSVIGQWTTRPGSVGSLFWTWLVAVSAAHALFNRGLTAPVRLLLFGVTALVFYHGLFDVRTWASGWVPPLVALGTIVLVRFPLFSVGMGLLALPMGLLFSGPISEALLSEEQYSLATRQEAGRVLWTLVERSPFLGTGPANYYYYTENLPILGWYVRFISHNHYQDLLVQTGLMGLLAFCWLVCEMFGMTLRVHRTAHDTFVKAYAVSALGGLTGSLVAGMLGDWIIPFYYNAGILGFRSSLLFWVLLGGVLALQRMESPRAALQPLPRRRTWPVPGGRLAEAR